jgi:muramoyltetrapeptide carboxypeptidase
MADSLKKPKRLNQGDTIQIIAPASPFDREAFLRGVTRLKEWGFQVRYRDDIFAKKRYLAGDDERRLAELQQALSDSAIKAVLVARGGYGSGRLLPPLEKWSAPREPKILLGYSDISSLLIFAQQRWGWVTFHGPVVAKDIGDRLGERGQSSLKRALTDPQPLGCLKPEGMVTLHPGKARGPLVGGCLSLINCTLGTPYQLKTEGCILYLEDVGELLYSLDRMLTHLRQAGLFKKVRGLLIGPLKDAHDSPEVIEEMLKDVLGDLAVPMLFGFPSGHTEDSLTIPLGLPVTLDAGAGSVTFEEGAVL